MSKLVKTGLVAGALMSIATTASATEHGLSLYPNGVENFMAGVAPPHPGLYGMLYSTYYSTDELVGNDGERTGPPVFEIDAKVLAARFAYVSNMDFMGGDVLFHTIIPVIELDARTGGPTATKDRDFGIGDITFGPGLAFHHSQSLHSVVAFDFYVPTGSYDVNNHANVGKNHMGYEFVYILGYMNPVGFNGDLKFGYLMNSKNDDTDYDSGDEFHFDYDAGWGIGNGWTLGVGGYFMHQMTDDKQNGVTIENNKAHTFAIGPSVKYMHGKDWFMTLKYESEVSVHNRSKGDALWLKFAMPLSVNH